MLLIKSLAQVKSILCKNISSNDSSVGITKKDSSKVFAENMTFTNVDVCLAAFNKKEFFTGGSIEIIRFRKLQCSYLVEKNSALVIGSKPVAPILKCRIFGMA